MSSHTIVGLPQNGRAAVLPCDSGTRLVTGILVVGAIGPGKTSACMYPYVDQLLAYRATDSVRKAAGLVLEVKGDFCRQVHGILRRHGREADYVGVSLDSTYLHVGTLRARIRVRISIPV